MANVALIYLSNFRKHSKNYFQRVSFWMNSTPYFQALLNTNWQDAILVTY